MNPSDRPSHNHWLKTIVWALVGILLACVVVEAILWLTDTNDYIVTPIDLVSGLHIHKPDSTYTTASACNDNVVVVNNLGFHGPPVSIAKKPGTFRIVVIGSSFVEADQMSVSQMFPVVLGNLLNASTSAVSSDHAGEQTITYDVIPLGFSGNGTYLDALYYERFGEMLKPDLVIDLETDYEFQNEYVHADPLFDANGDPIMTLPVHNATNPSPLSSWIHNTYHDSKLVMTLLSRASGLKQSESTAPVVPTATTASSAITSTSTATSSEPTSDVALWQTETKFMNALAGIVKASGAQFMLTSWATSGASTTTAEELVSNSQAIADEDGFSYLNLQPSIATEQQEQGASAGWPCGDGHWSPAGDLYAAQSLYQYLTAHPQLIGK